MDLGIAGKLAIVGGGSAGLGFACAQRLAEAGVNLLLVARASAALETAAQALRERHGVEVDILAADITQRKGVAALLGASPRPDIVVLSGAWPGSAQRAGDASVAKWQAGLQAMLLSQIEIIAGVTPGMAARGFGRVVAVTSRLIKDPEWELAQPSVARLGLTGYVKAASRELAARNVTLNTMLPGVFATETQQANTERLVAESGDREAVERQRLSLTPAARWGQPDEFGALCAFLCSAHAGFITGQAIVIDGGAHGGIW